MVTLVTLLQTTKYTIQLSCPFVITTSFIEQVIKVYGMLSPIFCSFGIFMSIIKKRSSVLSPLGRLASAARCGPGVSRKPFTRWTESAKLKLAKHMKQEPISFGSFDFECSDLVIGLILLDKSKEHIINVLKKKFVGIQDCVFNYVFEDEFRNGKDVADALVTNAAYRKAIDGNVQAIKILGIKMGWLDSDGFGDEDDIREVMKVFVTKRNKDEKEIAKETA